MAKPVNRIATYEDLFDLPDNVVGEIFSGDLVTHPRPSPRHYVRHLWWVCCLVVVLISKRLVMKMAGGFWTNQSVIWELTLG